MKLSRKHVDVGPEHQGHIIRFVEVCDPPPADDSEGIVCAVCRTCGNPDEDDSFVILALIEDAETIAAIVAEIGPLDRAYIEPGKGIQ